MMIPSTVGELARLLQTTFDLSTFVAFAASSVDRSIAGWRLTGPRIFFHWPNFRRQSTALQRIILQHEFTHRASFEVSGPFVQSFNDPVVLSTVNEIETLATGLSGKIWQKITLLERATRMDASLRDS